MTGIFQLIRIFLAGYMVIQLPGSPVNIISFHSGFAVACTSPGGVYLFPDRESPERTSLEVDDPADMISWDGSLAVSDRNENTVVLEDTVYSLPGSPEGICQVDWFCHGESLLAVCLFDTGQVVLLDSCGTIYPLARIPGAKDVAAADADSDGDSDLFVSGCGTGVVLLENRDAVPVLQEVGNIGEGVKRICTGDFDQDGRIDVAGIACADGGAGWWKNPLTPGGDWEYTELNGKLQGPKDISAKDHRLAVVSLFSPVFTTFGDLSMLPAGFTCCLLERGGILLLGHSRGFVGIPAVHREN